MADAEKKTDTKAEGQVEKKKGGVVGKIVLFIILLVVIVFAISYFSQIGKYKEALKLYDEGQYQQSHDKLLALQDAFPISTLQGKQIRRTLGLCKAQLADDLALSLKTPEGYRQAIEMLKEAQKLAPDATEISAQIEEYNRYIEAAASQNMPETTTEADDTQTPE